METSPLLSKKMRVSSGAPTTETSVTTARREKARVKSLRMNSSPRSGSSRSARTNTGTTREVSTAPRTISVTRLGSWLAARYASETPSASVAVTNTERTKPVMRDSSVATAMEPVARTTSESESEFPFPSASSWAAFAPLRLDLSSTGSCSTGMSRGSGTGAGGVEATKRPRVPDCGDVIQQLSMSTKLFSATDPEKEGQKNDKRGHKAHAVHTYDTGAGPHGNIDRFRNGVQLRRGEP